MSKANSNVKARAYAKHLKSRANARRVAADKLVVALSDKMDEIGKKIEAVPGLVMREIESSDLSAAASRQEASVGHEPIPIKVK